MYVKRFLTGREEVGCVSCGNDCDECSETTVVSDWQRFFDEFAVRYDKECFVQNTEEEIPFLLEQLAVRPGGCVLDVGCGTGRHSVGLAVAGLAVTGVDLSEGMLDKARARAKDAGVSVELVQGNAAGFCRPNSYDGAICLCEGAMCLLGAGDDALERDMVILKNVYESLRRGGRFVLNVLNACRAIRRFTDEDVAAGRFDPVKLTERSEIGSLMKCGGEGIEAWERGYTAPEVQRMLQWTGFTVLGIYGGTAGSWGLRVPLLDDWELMAIVEK